MELPDDHAQIYQRFLAEIEASAANGRSATDFWVERCARMRDDARAGSPYDFLRWPSLDAFSVPEAWIPLQCYDDLKNDAAWKRRWFHLTRETKIGAPKDFSRDFGTSPILVQHVYHLMRYEAVTGRSLLDCDVIFEVGGGYGSFCRLLRNAGFSGLHLIYDLPQVAAIQRLYLQLSGFKEIRSAGLSSDSDGFCLVSDADLSSLHGYMIREHCKVGFVATWSLSEAPAAVRDLIFPRFHDVCDNYLIAFQPGWETIDNHQYFDGVARSRPDMTWFKSDMPRVIEPASAYLFA